VQLAKVERHAEIRGRQVAIYDSGLAGLDGVEPVARDVRDVHANHLYVVRITFADRDEVQRALTDENIGTSIHFLPVHRLSAYRERLAPNQPPLPVTERAGAEVLSLPLSPAHSDDDIRDAVAAFRRVYERLS
jgi:dTDP-4-amino-4,6-dideoxygalactose transaminase